MEASTGTLAARLYRTLGARVTAPAQALFADAGPILLLVAALSAKMLYFAFAADPRAEWFRPWWLQRTLLATAGSVGSLLLLFSPLLLLSPRARIVAAWTGSLVLSLLLYADVLYVRYFGDVLSVAALGAAPQLLMITESILALMRPVDVLLFADLIVLPLLLRRASTRSRSAATRSALVLLGVGVLLSVYPVVIMIQRGEYDYLKLRGAAKVGVLNYHAYDAIRQTYLAASAEPIGAAERERVRAFLERPERAGGAPSELFGIARGRNLIVVMVEALHAFPVGLVVNGQEVTPHLNRLARRSMTFEHFYDQTWQGVTSDGEFTALQSLHPLPEGGVPTRYGNHRFFALPQVLHENGYTTLSAHGYSGAIWMMSTAHRAYGFDRSYFRESFDQTERIGMGLSDASFFRQLLPRLQREREPFMAFLVTLSTHFPFGLPEELREPGLAVPEGTLVAAYLQSVHQLDRAFGEFLAGLEAGGLLDRSVLVLFGDHGAFAGDEQLDVLLSRYAGYPERAPGLDHRYWLAEKRLPLLIHLPGDSAAGPRSGSAGHLDIAPTLLALLGISRPHMVSLGRDMTAPGNSLVVFRDGSFVLGPTACVRPSPATATTQCRDTEDWRTLDPAGLRGAVEEARSRLEVSDLLLAGDLIPWASQLGSR
jgi:lipoteichoic acid synthase